MESREVDRNLRIVHCSTVQFSIAPGRKAPLCGPLIYKFLSHKNLVSIGAMEELSSGGSDNAVYILLIYCSSSILT